MTPTAGTVTADGLLSRLRKVEGQVRGLQHMVERDEAWDNILVQVAAARAALAAIGFELVAFELNHVVASEDPHERAAAATDVLTAVHRIAAR